MFDNADAPPEEKTVAPVGPINDVPMQYSTERAPPVPAVPAERPEDTRAPVGLDAGAPEVTDAAENEGGWHGGAEEEERKEPAAHQESAPLGAVVDIPEIELDDEGRRLAADALRDDEGVHS